MFILLKNKDLRYLIEYFVISYYYIFQKVKNLNYSKSVIFKEFYLNIKFIKMLKNQ